MEQRSRTRQLLPASRFHPRQFRTYNGEISLVFCTIRCGEARRLRSRPPPFVSFFFSFKLTLVLFPPRKGKRRTHESQGLGANLEYPCESNRFYYASGDALVFRARLRNAKSFGFLSSRTFESEEKIYTSKNESIGNRLFRFYIIHHLLSDFAILSLRISGISSIIGSLNLIVS